MQCVLSLPLPFLITPMSIQPQLIYSPTLRPKTAGAIITGALPGILPLNITSPLSIPARQSAHHHWDICSASCVDAVMKGQAGRARVMAAGMHMHTAGVGGEMRVRKRDRGPLQGSGQIAS